MWSSLRYGLYRGNQVKMSSLDTNTTVHAQCLTPCDPLDCSLLDSSVHRIPQARVLEWVAISSSRGSPRPRDQTHVSCTSCSGRSSLGWVLIRNAWGPYEKRNPDADTHTVRTPGERGDGRLQAKEKRLEWVLSSLAEGTNPMDTEGTNPMDTLVLDF